MPRRASILLHTHLNPKKNDPHFDLLIENGQKSACWRFFPSPHCASDLAHRLVLREQFPHRRFYHDYSGVISGDRGSVRCVWKGKAELFSDRVSHLFIKVYDETTHMKIMSWSGRCHLAVGPMLSRLCLWQRVQKSTR